MRLVETGTAVLMCWANRLTRSSSASWRPVRETSSAPAGSSTGQSGSTAAAAPRRPAPRSAGGDRPPGPGTSSPPARPAPARSAAGRPAAATPIRVTGLGPSRRPSSACASATDSARIGARCAASVRSASHACSRQATTCTSAAANRPGSSSVIRRTCWSKAAWSRTGAVSPRKASMQASAVSASSASAPPCGKRPSVSFCPRSRPECPRGPGLGTASATSRRTPRRCVRAGLAGVGQDREIGAAAPVDEGGEAHDRKSRDAAIDLLGDRAEDPGGGSRLQHVARCADQHGLAVDCVRSLQLGQIAGLSQHRPRLVEHPVPRQQVQRHPRQVPVRGGHAHAGEPRDSRSDPVQQRAAPRSPARP